MIQYIRRKDLDVKKYNICIENSLQSRIYAFSWYLDIVAAKWDVLVLDDYEAVMPIPWKQKYFIKYITQPFFCQQLGIFSTKEIVEKDIEKFINEIPKKFLNTSLHFNSGNSYQEKTLKLQNYILPLHDSYDTLFGSFNKGRKHAVKTGKKNNLSERLIDVSSLITIAKENYHYATSSKINFELLKNISEYIQKNDRGFTMGIFNNDEILGGAVILKDNHRITYLFSSYTNNGKKLQAPSFLVNRLIKKYSGSNLILDFEGSIISNIASFYRSFGAEEETYFSFKK